MPKVRSFSSRTLGRAVLVAVLGVTTVARADVLADVQRLYYGGQAAEAMKRADEALAAIPSDPSMRFMKGVMLADAKRGAEATPIFEKLAQDYPDLAEPYNNLAALYAEGGQYDKARSALEQALRVNPAYAAAYENLGDVYAALAAQAYQRALRLDPKTQTASAKLERARHVSRPEGDPAAPAVSPP